VHYRVAGTSTFLDLRYMLVGPVDSPDPAP